MQKLLLILGPFIVFLIVTCSVCSASPNSQVYRVHASSCGPKNERFALTGFRTVVQGETGLVTALHGVVGCRRVVALQEEMLGSTYVQDLVLRRVNTQYDVAFFSSATLAQKQQKPLLGTNAINSNNLKVVGYPQGSTMQLNHPLQFFDNPLRTLSKQFAGSPTIQKLEQRNSPSTHIGVLMVRGLLQSGYSGGPIITQNEMVVGVANGGLAQGFAQINWAIPFGEIPWGYYNQSDPEIQRLSSMDAASLFHSPWASPSNIPTTGVNISGTILYNNKPVSFTTKAYAVIELMETDSRRSVPIDFQYDNNRGTFTIFNVPPGKYTPFVRMESGYPYHIESGGDFFSRLSGLNPDIYVAPHDNQLQRNFNVVQSIHLRRPIDNQVRRISTNAPPKNLYQSFYAPSAELFEWDPVPGATSYQVVILTVTKPGTSPLHIIDKRISQPRFAPGLGVSSLGTQYMFRVEAYNSSNQHIGTYIHYYTNGSGGWLNFRVIPRP